jgi:hypothetical protein
MPVKTLIAPSGALFPVIYASGLALRRDGPSMKDEFDNEEDSGMQKADDIRSQVQCGIETATDYIRANPWVGVAGGLVLGAVVFALCKPAKPEPTTLDRLRDLLDEAYAKLPTKKEAKSAASCLLSKLHIPV